MKKKTVSRIMLALLLIGTSTLAFNIQPVKAFSTVYIRSDGSIDPPTAPIFTRDNATYAFIGDMDSSFAIERDDVHVEGAGHNIGGPNSKTLIIQNRKNVSIANLTLGYFDDERGLPLGVQVIVTNSSNIRIVGNVIFPPDFNLEEGYGSIFLSSSSYINICGNDIQGGDPGTCLWISSSSKTTVQNNLFRNVYGIITYGILSSSSSDNLICNNYVRTSSCIWGDFENCTILGNYMRAYRGCGIFLSGSLNHITNNTILSTYGFSPYGEQYFVLTGDKNCVSENRLIGDGVYLSGSHSDIFRNSILGGERGRPSWTQVFLSSFVENNFFENTLESNGVEFLNPCWNNSFYHNNFLFPTFYFKESANTIDNGSQIGANYWNGYKGSANTWDKGYPFGGNYWDWYAGLDLFSGTYQNVSGSDGIGDTPLLLPGWDEGEPPHDIAPNNRDNYPLMEPWSTPTMIKTQIRTVKFLNLQKGIEKSLTSKLEGALYRLDVGNRNAAAQQLKAFINQVEALRNKKFAIEQAALLTAEVQRIIDDLQR